jgi:exodeoxyribonuclease VII large subunit
MRPQLPLIEPGIWNVTELTLYLRDLIESDVNLQDTWVQGEVSNLSRPRSGHMYFTLKDSASALRCVMWRNTVDQQTFLPRDGQTIEVHGSINIYEAQGQYQLYADKIRPIGEGALYQAFMRLKAQLEIEGLFSPERKRPIPKMPKQIGIVTSPTGAALRDILNTLQRRYPLAEVTLAPSQVQGSEAPDLIVSALRSLNRIVKPDVIILARGGGSIEDLWAFNEEKVARAIVESQAPVITGIGHETDFTIADFVADLRAPTPTAAAELATPNQADLSTGLMDLVARLEQSMRIRLEAQHWRLANLMNRLMLRSPITYIRSSRQRLDEIGHRFGYAIEHRIHMHQAQLQGLNNQLTSLNPLSILDRGYAAIAKSDGQLVKSIYQVQQNDLLQARLSDGQLEVKVEGIKPQTDD